MNGYESMAYGWSLIRGGLLHSLTVKGYKILLLFSDIFVKVYIEGWEWKRSKCIWVQESLRPVLLSSVRKYIIKNVTYMVKQVYIFEFLTTT